MFFSMLAGIIPLSLRNGGGAFDTVCPLLVCKCGGQLPLAHLPMVQRYISGKKKFHEDLIIVFIYNSYETNIYMKKKMN